jgi:hypothetical protein
MGLEMAKVKLARSASVALGIGLALLLAAMWLSLASPAEADG